MAEKENKEIKKAIRALDFISADPKERERHNSILMAEYNRLTSEHNFFEAGKEERNSKMKIWAEEKNGEIKGKKEKSIEIAKKLLEMGIPVEKIIEATSLTKEEIEKIKYWNLF